MTGGGTTLGGPGPGDNEPRSLIRQKLLVVQGGKKKPEHENFKGFGG